MSSHTPFKCNFCGSKDKSKFDESLCPSCARIFGDHNVVTPVLGTAAAPVDAPPQVPSDATIMCGRVFLPPKYDSKDEEARKNAAGASVLEASSHDKDVAAFFGLSGTQ